MTEGLLPLLTPEVVAERLGCSVKLARARMRAMPHFLLGKTHLRVSEQDFERARRRGLSHADVCAIRGEKPVVYFVQAACGPIKIGWSKNLDQRLATLQRYSAEKVTLLATMRGALLLEQELHERFAAHRLHGEWFSPAEELLYFIRDNAVSA